MRLISNAIREGAEAFMSRQYTTIGALAVVLAVALFVGYKFSDFTAPLAGKVVISFLIGAICSGFAGFTGMFVSYPHQYPRRQRGPFQPRPGPEDRFTWRSGHRHGGDQPLPAGCGRPLLSFRRVEGSAARSLSAGGLWLRRVAGCPVCPARRGYLHQGSGRGSGPGGQGRSRDSRGRSSQSCCDC